jgi:arginine repressor
LGHHIEHLVEEELFSTFDQLVEILNAGGVEISRTTLVSILSDRGFASYIAAHTSKIMDQNKEKRVTWCHEHVQCPIHKWGDLIWSDESQFTIERSISSTRVIRKKGERFDS